MIRYILTKNNIEMFDLYDKFLKNEPKEDLKNEDNKLKNKLIKDNKMEKSIDDLSNNETLYESDSEYSEMFISDEEFEYVDISNSEILIKEEKKEENEDQKEEENEDQKEEENEDQKKEEKKKFKINKETGILRQSFYNLGNYLFNI